MRSFNLLVSTYRNREDDCISELWYLLKEVGDEQADVWRTNVSGLVVAKTKLDPFKVVSKLEAMAKERPWDFRYVLKLVPIEVLVPTSLEEISKAAGELAERKIAPHESFRVTVNKRITQFKTSELIEAAASKISRKVDLSNPDKIVQVEVIGEATGISVLKPSEIVSIVKLLGR